GQEEVTVSSEAEGRVVRIQADLGDRVHAGQVLVELDHEKAQYLVDQQRAALAQALAKYGVDASGAPLADLKATPDVQKAAAELAQAEESWTRASELQRRQLVPKQQLDDAEAVRETARASYASALQGARNLRASIDATEAALRLAERELRDAAIRAPFDGYVSKRLVSPGQFVAVHSAIMDVVRVDPLKLTAEVPERMTPWVKVGQAIDVAVDAFPGRVFRGAVARISPSVNQQTRAFPLEGRVPNADGMLKPGTFARVRITSDETEEILTVPAAALQYRYGVNRLFILAGDRLLAREVTVGDRLGDRVEVMSGVKAGEAFATTDVDNLADGMRVTVARAE
ncbi:MAG TPA: efflux RND transporter periplasmic adaptor subunit, partial [Vicinamibacterales bacterium]|nr:efflux RND transporter periplasmic adaptor subunit [Vicinamibacterales bacterium]